MDVNLDGSQNVKRTIFYTHWIIHCIKIIKLSFSFPMIPGYLKLIQKLKVTSEAYYWSQAQSCALLFLYYKISQK